MLKRHIDHGVEHGDVPPHAVGVQATCQLMVSKLSDVRMAQLVQGYIAKLAYKKRIGVLRNDAELAPVSLGVFSHVNVKRI